MFVSKFTDEIFSVTTQMQQEEIEHVEEVEQQSGQIQCLDEATIIEQDEEEEIEEEIEEEEVDGMFTLELDEASEECEDKEYLGKCIEYLINQQSFGIVNEFQFYTFVVYSRICECSDIMSVSRAICVQFVSKGVQTQQMATNSYEVPFKLDQSNHF